MHGHGTFIWPDERKYIGNYVQDRKDGYGIFEWKDGRKYKGQWLNGKQHGEGEFYSPKDNTWRRGLWEKGKRKVWLD